MRLAPRHRAGLSKYTAFNLKHVAQPVREPLKTIPALASYTIDYFFTVIEGIAPSLCVGTVPCPVFPSSVTCLFRKLALYSLLLIIH